MSSDIAFIREPEAVATLASMGRIGNDIGGEAEVEVETSELTKVLTSSAIKPGVPAIGQAAGFGDTSASQSSFSESYTITGASQNSQSSQSSGTSNSSDLYKDVTGGLGISSFVTTSNNTLSLNFPSINSESLNSQSVNSQPTISVSLNISRQYQPPKFPASLRSKTYNVDPRDVELQPQFVSTTVARPLTMAAYSLPFMRPVQPILVDPTLAHPVKHHQAMNIDALPAAATPQHQMAAPGVVMPGVQPVAVRGAIPPHQIAIPDVSITQVVSGGANHQHQVALAPQPDLSDPYLEWQPALPLSVKTAHPPGQRKPSLKANTSKRDPGAKGPLKQRDKNRSLMVRLKVPKGRLTSTPAPKRKTSANTKATTATSAAARKRKREVEVEVIGDDTDEDEFHLGAATEKKLKVQTPPVSARVSKSPILRCM